MTGLGLKLTFADSTRYSDWPYGAPAQLASKVLDRPVQVRDMSFSDWVESTKPPFDDPQLRLLAKVHEHYAAHGLGGNALTLRAILGHEPRSLPDYIAELAQL